MTTDKTLSHDVSTQKLPPAPLTCSAQTSVLSPALFTVRDLSLSYSQRVAFKNVTLDLPERQVTALVGPSGCGKTSFLYCLNRMIEFFPGAQVSGQLLLKDLDLLSGEVDRNTLRRRVGLVFQKPNPFPLSILKNLLLPLREHYKCSMSEQMTLAENALKSVGLWEEVKDRLHTSALSLSGGQQQRLCIARALILEPEVLLMDEPCSALDPLSSDVIEDLILQLRQQVTLIVVTHNLAQARRVSDQTAVFWSQGSGGYLLETGPTAALFTQPQQTLTRDYVLGRRG